MIFNIVDRRKRKYRWKSVNAIIEPTAQDNCCDDSDQAIEDEAAPFYEEWANIFVHDAVAWAEGLDHVVTLYLYDRGRGI
jgi:hypothetical protein